MSSPYTIAILSKTDDTLVQLTGLLQEVVAAGGSVGFMHPVSTADALSFWKNSFDAAERGERVVLGCVQEGSIQATVTLLLKCPPNQPHRAEIAKMMTRVDKRGQGMARALLMEAERLAAHHKKTLLILDTAEDDGAAGLYERSGYQRTGVIPYYALKPHGGLTGTIIFWKWLG